MVHKESSLQTQARIWLGEVLHVRFNEKTPIADLLADGELLFQVSKVLWKMLLEKHVELKDSKVFIHERTSFAKGDVRYMPYPKIDSFFKICQILGLTGIDLFSPSDVVEKRDVRRVCLCIRSLSKKARSKHLSVPDFDIVTYTIDTPIDLVGGICRNLEQSGSSSSSSGSYCMDFRRIYIQKYYSGHHDQSHDYCYESDEAESSFNELEFEHPPLDASNIFNLDGEDFPQGSLDDDKLSKLHAYFELERQPHGVNGHRIELHGKSIFLESIGSPCGSITYSSSTKLQTDESEIAYSIDDEQGLSPLGWSRFGKQIWNSDIECCHRFFLSSTESPYEVEVQMRGKENQSYIDTVPEKCIPKSSTSETLISTADENKEIIEAFVGGTFEKASSKQDKHNIEFDSRIQHEEDQDGIPAYMHQFHDGKSTCKNMTWLMGEKDENLCHIACENLAGTQEKYIRVNSKTTAHNSVYGFALPDHSIKAAWVSPESTSQNIHDADFVLPDSEPPDSLVSLSTRNEDSQGNGSRCEHEVRTIDQAIDAEVSYIPTLEFVLDEAAKFPSGAKLHHNNLSAGIFLSPTVHSFKYNATSSFVSEVYSNEHSTYKNWKDRAFIRPQNHSLFVESNYLASTLKTSGLIPPGQSDGLDDSRSTVSKGQEFTGILDGSYLKDTLLTSTCSTPTYGTLESERRLVLDTEMPEKTKFFHCILARDGYQQCNKLVVHKDEDATVDRVSGVNIKAYGQIVGCQMHKPDSNLIGAQSELKEENLDTENECEMVTDCSYHDPCEANRDFFVVVGSNFLGEEFGKNKSNHYMECETISGSFRESISDLIGLHTNYEHPISVPTADDSCISTCSGGSNKQTLPVEERIIGHSQSSVPTGKFSVHDASYVSLQHMDKSIVNKSYKTCLQTRNNFSGKNCVNNLDPYWTNEICGLGTGGAKVTRNSEVPCSHFSKDLHHMEYMGTYNANEVTSDRTYVSGTVSTSEPAPCSNSIHTSAPADFVDDCTKSQATRLCSSHGILAEGKVDTSAEMNLEVKYQDHHLIDDVGTSMTHKVPAVTEETKRDMKECKDNQLNSMTLSGKNREGTVAEVRNPGKKVLKSIAGSVTLIGAVLLFLHVRRTKDEEKNSHTGAPLQTKETCQQANTQNKMETGKSDKKYPGAKLKL